MPKVLGPINLNKITNLNLKLVPEATNQLLKKVFTVFLMSIVPEKKRHTFQLT